MRCSLSASEGPVGLLQGLVAGGWSDGSLPVPPESGACPGGEQGASGWLGCSVAPTPSDDLRPRFPPLSGGLTPP